MLRAHLLWTPGYTVWSDYAAADGTTDIPGGVLGFEIAGMNGLSKSRRFRVLAGPQVVVPMPNPDYQTEIDRAEDGGDWSINTAKHVFVNLLADFVYHFPGKKASYLDPTQKRTVDFGYTLIAELELSYGVPLWGRNALNRRSVTLQVASDIRIF